MTQAVQDLSLHQFTGKLKSNIDKVLVKGDTWYLIDSNWFLKCKKYIGFDGGLHEAGRSKLNPGPINNIALFQDDNSDELRYNLIEDVDYTLVPKEAWDLLVARFTVLQNCRRPTIARKVIQIRPYAPHVELCLIKLKLVEYRHQKIIVEKKFSAADTIGSIENIMRLEFNIDERTKTRIYTNSILLDKPESTISIQLGVFNGQTIIIQQMNEDGTWPPRHHSSKNLRQATKSYKSRNLTQTEASLRVESERGQTVDDPKYISANDVNVDLEQTNNNIVESLKTKIDNLNDKHKERDLLDTTENDDLEKRHQENLKAITLKKEKLIAKIENQEKTEIETENSIFITERENLKVNQNAIRTAIVSAIDELSKKLDKINGVEEENPELKKVMECPVCFDQMKPPTRIFQCTSGHLLCGDCKSRMNDAKCPTCKKAQLMGRATAMEQMARALYGEEN